ncbi:MAG: ATP-binding protein [Bacteroidia bacterium]|nr:ATP-binding protein [Bacteroidia bacterium]
MITRLHVQNFKGIADLRLNGFTGLNVLLGVNDTGKTGLLKLMYALSKSIRSYSLAQKTSKESFTTILEDKLKHTFKPRISGINELISSGETEASIEAGFDLLGSRIDPLSVHIISDKKRKTTELSSPQAIPLVHEDFDSVFLPPKEVLSIHRDIIYSREKGELDGFDDTYYDLAKALERSTTKGRTHDALVTVINKLEKLFTQTKVYYDEVARDFYLEKKGTRYSITMAAEGIRKIGLLTTLIRNRELYRDGHLFVDEPETTLHPVAIRSFMEMLLEMTKANIQVFLATHNYFVLKELEILAKTSKIPVMCYSLMKDTDAISVESSDLREAIPDNEIIEESIRLLQADLRTKI